MKLRAIIDTGEGITGKNYISKVFTLNNLFDMTEVHSIDLYTGLKDKNGKEICGGDIVRDSDDTIGFVEWNDEFAGFNIKTKKDVYDVRSRWEVIGNIYENPELLEDKEE